MQPKLTRIVTTSIFGLIQAIPLWGQEAQPSPAAWHGEHWHGAWGFGWIFPALMLLMVLLCVAWLFFARRRSGTGGYQTWCPSWGPCRTWGDSTASPPDPQ